MTSIYKSHVNKGRNPVMMSIYKSYVSKGKEPSDDVNIQAGLGRVLDKSTRVQVKVLEKMTSTSTSTSTGLSKVLKYKYKYFKKYLSTSTEYFDCKL